MLGDKLCKGRMPEGPKDGIFLVEFLLEPIRVF
jgi:hypothetical protein